MPKIYYKYVNFIYRDNELGGKILTLILKAVVPSSMSFMAKIMLMSVKLHSKRACFCNSGF